MSTTKLNAYRCTKCQGTDVGYHATSTFDLVTQEWVLGHEFDTGWCNDCGPTVLAIYELQGDERAAVLAQQQKHARQALFATNGQALADALTSMVAAFAPMVTEENALIVANAKAVIAIIGEA
ncbi:hypothetical protein [Bordetella pseudohinzii]|uniref:Uncharacterized protein n=1 Tax=Bordetella pseudohinzii TaxID=1331258 RepID=A0A0J6BQJ9_9BORD|nr:hypothetical protein [Bordetella pseudohinzii]ANY18488.1 hypothetical protein BBN53_20915 [Bordetella pseudohinzii]KMM24109.1 hypothetical protein L540_08260 [Bordetella pseudohinzii]KXA77887.1 hypothetical protein AW878_14425 [Bordetella pseudohinzii]KXA78082.1 hypothetical protein AW877_12880 [Bordetella pseudohinzii]CUJ13063.1 Uncharacterised protein [Bordetella pseudohinzii]